MGKGIIIMLTPTSRMMTSAEASSGPAAIGLTLTSPPPSPPRPPVPKTPPPYPPPPEAKEAAEVETHRGNDPAALVNANNLEEEVVDDVRRWRRRSSVR